MLLKLPETAMQGLRKALSSIYTKKIYIYIHGLNRHSFVITAILKIKTYVFLQLLNLVFIRYVSLC